LLVDESNLIEMVI